MKGGKSKRRPEVGRATGIVAGSASKADLIEVLVDFVRLSHPESADTAPDEWIADQLQFLLNCARERSGRPMVPLWRRTLAKLQEGHAARAEVAANRARARTPDGGS